MRWEITTTIKFYCFLEGGRLFQGLNELSCDPLFAEFLCYAEVGNTKSVWILCIEEIPNEDTIFSLSSQYASLIEIATEGFSRKEPKPFGIALH